MMKQILTFLTVLFFSISSFGQTPEGMSYQAVVRDNGDALVASAVTPIQISILQNTANGTAVYVETQNPTTNANGLFNIQIGTGTVVSGTFSGIDWPSNAHFIKTEIDIDNNGSYDITGASQLLTVPYALHVKTADSVTEIQTLAEVIALGNTADAQIKNVTDPTDPQDVATKAYADVVATNITALETRITVLETTGSIQQRLDNGETPLSIYNSDHTLLNSLYGKRYLDGIIFYFNTADGTGLVSDDSDDLTAVQILTSNNETLGADGTAIGTGYQNTIDLLGSFTSGVFLRTTPDHLSPTRRGFFLHGYVGWHIPSIDELVLMYNNIGPGNALGLGNIGFFTAVGYLSSSEIAVTTIDPDGPPPAEELKAEKTKKTNSTTTTFFLRAIDTTSGQIINFQKNGKTLTVRLIRTF